MRVSRQKAAENRNALLQAASRLFRKQGIDGVGVAEVARAAGLTHGALYAHFPSKDALAAEAFSHGFEGSKARIRARTGDRPPSFEEYLDAFFSARMRDSPATGCPMAASASEIARQGRAVRASFAQAFEEMAALMAGSIGDAIPPSRKRRLAIASVAAQIGAIAVSRAVAKIDADLADEVLQSVRETVGTAYNAEKAGADLPDACLQ